MRLGQEEEALRQSGQEHETPAMFNASPGERIEYACALSDVFAPRVGRPPSCAVRQRTLGQGAAAKRKMTAGLTLTIIDVPSSLLIARR